MKPTTVAWLTGLGILVAFVALGILLPGPLGVTGTAGWLLRALLWLLGAAAALLVFLYLRARARALPEVAPADDEMDQLLAAVRKRLPGRGALGRTPVILVLGPRGSAKTTVVVRSGLDPELLSGEVRSGDDVVPTDLANFWLASGTVVAEAGGSLVEDPPRWARLLRRLQPSRLGAVLARGRQAPRLAVACVACDDLVRPGATESVIASAQALRTRLTEAAQQFGVRLPVYVLFTKADRLRYFTDYVRSFTREEATEVLGATLPVPGERDPGRYREEEAERVTAAFEGILRTLSLRRPEILARETSEEVRAGAYEFPRELRKASGVAARFLVELCRPPQSGSRAFLRGFYFTGVRPVVVRETSEPLPPPVAHGGSAVDATSVFDPRAMIARAQEAAAPSGGSRRVPEWTFLPRLFRDVFLADRVAMGMTGGGDTINLLRRFALGSALGLLVIAAGGMGISFFGNQKLLSDARSVVSAVQGVDLAGLGLAPAEDLARLDSVRTLAATLRTWDVGRPPVRYRWGLYRGQSILQELRSVYFHRFERMLWGGTRERLILELATLPDAPTATSDYTAAFETLRAYVVVTDHPELSTQEIMTPVLFRHWTGGRGIEEERESLGRVQFDFFASELAHGNPYELDADPALLDRTRRYLALFGETDRLYQALLNEASRQAPAVAFHQEVPGSEAVLRADRVIPGAFTAGGWEFVQANVDNVDRFFASDAWVVGDQTVSAADRARMSLELRDRYQRDYVQSWVDLIASASVPPYVSAQDAARTLQQLGGNQSPLLQLLAIVSRNTAVDTMSVGRAFQPVHSLIPPDAADRFIQPASEGYVTGLDQLARTMTQVAAGGAQQQAGLSQAQGEADRVSGTVRQLAQGFSVEGDARAVGAAVQQLLEQPVARLRPLVARIPAAETNQIAASFCSAVAPVLSRYPFSQSASAEATLDEVNAAFQPSGSALSTLLDGLQDLLVRQGAEYRPRPTAERAPTPEFLEMLNRAVRISEALYAPGAAAPTVQFTVQPLPTETLPEIVVTIDGRNHTVTRADFQRRGFEWDARSAREAQIAARVGDAGPRPLVTYQGTWSSFRLFGQAQWSEVAAGVYRLSWNVNPGGTLTAELSFPQRTPIFNPGVIGGIGGCISTVLR